MVDVEREVIVELVGVALLEDEVGTELGPDGILELLVRAGSELVGQGIVDEPVLAEETVVLQHTGEILRELLGAETVLVLGLGRRDAGNDLAEERRRQITVVIAAGIAGVLPSKGGITVLTETQGGGGVQTGTLGSIPRIIEHDDRLVSIANAGIAQLTVLVTDVGIVIVAAEEPVSLVGRSLLGTALRRRSESGEGQPMAVAEELLDGEEIRIGIVIHPVDVTVAPLARTDGNTVRPPVVQLPGSIGNHGAETIHLIAVGDADAQPLTHLGSTRVDVGHTGDAPDTEIGRSEPGDGILVAGSVVETAPQRPRAVTGHGVVEADTVEVDVGILRIVTPDVETHLGKTIRSDAVEEVLGRRKRRRQGLLVGSRRIAVELGEDRIVETVGSHQRRDDDRGQIAHVLPDADAQLELLELGSLERDAVIALREVLEDEITVVVGDGGQPGGFERDTHVAQRLAAAARNDLATDTAVLRIRAGTNGRSEEKEK